MNREEMDFLSLRNLQAIDSLYQSFLKDPQSIDSSWRYFFEGMQFGQQAFSTLSSYEKQSSPDLRIYLLIQAYREFGHLFAENNPIRTTLRSLPNELQLQTLGFKEEELKSSFPTCGFLKTPAAPLEEIIETLQKTYCCKVGVECTGLGSIELEKWIQEQIEPNFPLHLDQKKRLAILEDLTKAEIFETFLHTKFVGQKRFSLEGCETIIPMLSFLINQGSLLGAKEIVLGMAHRGRLNVLANILNKSYRKIFDEFEDHYLPSEFEGTGDVKYHKGFVGALKVDSGKEILVTLVANPSHLETVDPVVEGIARAKQELTQRDSADPKTENKKNIVPILIHGDASIAGQGVVYETFQLSKLNGYSTGGTIHIVINNQIGFTTLPQDTRSTRYCSEIGRAFGSPVFHVNAEDPESCIRTAQLAIEIRQRFGCDVLIDILCYRKYGHNESDEPTFTQPLECALIKSKSSIRSLFKEKLVKEGSLSQEEAIQLEENFKASLQKELDVPSKEKKEDMLFFQEMKKDEALFSTPQVDVKTLRDLTDASFKLPEDLHIHPKIAKLIKERKEMIALDPSVSKIDWGMAEHLAYATLLNEKIHVRLSGQDIRRGTFSHRHAIFVDQVKEKKFFPLSHISPNQAPFDIFNSPLSEYAVLGFDFGYSVAYPNSLVIWEAQFGDFVNGAQIIIDQYISSSAQKWDLFSNLTLLLPHGNEGQGPEHSSARIERFLQQCAQDNLRVCNCSTPSQFFHLLRSQAYLNKKRPLVVFTPKALLRHPNCTSSLNDLTNGSFQKILNDNQEALSSSRLLFCSGKVYYDLLQKKEQQQAHHIAIIRVEQLYPFPKMELEEVIAQYRQAKEFYWVQEEHENMGAWHFIHPLLSPLLKEDQKLNYVGRKESAAPATGSHALHQKQLQELLQKAFETNR